MDGILITVELNSVNKRGLETAFSLPKDWNGLERPMAEQIKAKLQRGRVQAWLQYETPASQSGLSFDQEAIQQTLARLADLAKASGVAFSATPEVFWQIAYQNRQSAELQVSRA